MFVVDTNVLVHAVDRRSPFHGVCREALERWRRGPGGWFTAWSILYEFVRVTTHRSVLRPPLKVREAWSVVESLLASPALSVLTATPRHASVAAAVFRELPDLAGNLVHDAHVAILMREHGVRRIYTRDTDFHRFAFLEPIDPVSALGPAGAREPGARYGPAPLRAVRRRRAR